MKDQPWLLDIPEEPVHDDPKYKAEYAQALSKCDDIIKKKEHLAKKYGIALTEDTATPVRLNAFIIHMLGSDTTARLEFENKWLEVIVDSLEQAHNACEQQVRDQEAAKKAPKLHMPNGQVHVVPPNPFDQAIDKDPNG